MGRRAPSCPVAASWPPWVCLTLTPYNGWATETGWSQERVEGIRLVVFPDGKTSAVLSFSSILAALGLSHPHPLQRLGDGNRMEPRARRRNSPGRLPRWEDERRLVL